MHSTEEMNRMDHKKDEGHEHTHEHKEHSPEEALALLSYMTAHNEHHAEELHELAHSLSGEAAELIHEAVAAFCSGNEKLEAALAILKGE